MVVRTAGGGVGWGSRRRARLEAPPDATVLAEYLDGSPAAVKRRVGRGGVVYLGVHAGSEVEDPRNAVGHLVAEHIGAAAGRAGDSVDRGSAWAHLDELAGPGGTGWIVIAPGAGTVDLEWRSDVSLRGVFSGRVVDCEEGRIRLCCEAPYGELFVPEAGPEVR